MADAGGDVGQSGQLVQAEGRQLSRPEVERWATQVRGPVVDAHQPALRLRHAADDHSRYLLVEVDQQMAAELMEGIELLA